MKTEDEELEVRRDNFAMEAALVIVVAIIRADPSIGKEKLVKNTEEVSKELAKKMVK